MGVIREGGLVFDIGAHHGESAERMMAYKPAMIVSVEPCWQNYRAMVDGVASRHHEVVPLHAAIWSCERIGGVRWAANQDGLSTLLSSKWREIYPDAGFSETVEDVACITLNLLREHYGTPCYIKIDVEGAEVDALRGMGFKSDFLTFEFHEKYKPDAISCLHRVKELGFTVGRVSDTDVDYDAMPFVPVDEIIGVFTNQCPGWGNITVG